MRMIAALVVLCTAAITVPALAQTEGNSSQQIEALPLPPDPPPPCSDRGELRQLLALRRWEVARPMAGQPPACGGLALYQAKLERRFQRWRTYRQLTPYRGCNGGGKWLTYTAIPGSVVAGESECSWGAYNTSSGACGPYQFIGWTSCDASSWADKMRHHRVAGYVLRVQGPGAWSAW